IRAKAIRKALERERARHAGESHSGVILNFPGSLNPDPLRRLVAQFANYAVDHGAKNAELVEGGGFIAVDGALQGGEATWKTLIASFLSDRVKATQFHPDVWKLVYVTDYSDLEGKLAEASGSEYSYRDLDDFTDAIEKR